jgi:hypothetical protein
MKPPCRGLLAGLWLPVAANVVDAAGAALFGIKLCHAVVELVGKYLQNCFSVQMLLGQVQVMQPRLEKLQRMLQAGGSEVFKASDSSLVHAVSTSGWALRVGGLYMCRHMGIALSNFCQVPWTVALPSDHTCCWHAGRLHG